MRWREGLGNVNSVFVDEGKTERECVCLWVDVCLIECASYGCVVCCFFGTS